MRFSLATVIRRYGNFTADLWLRTHGWTIVHSWWKDGNTRRLSSSSFDRKPISQPGDWRAELSTLCQQRPPALTHSTSCSHSSPTSWLKFATQIKRKHAPKFCSTAATSFIYQGWDPYPGYRFRRIGRPGSGIRAWVGIGCESGPTLSAAAHHPRSTCHFLWVERLFLTLAYLDNRTAMDRVFRRWSTSLAALMRRPQHLGLWV